MHRSWSCSTRSATVSRSSISCAVASGAASPSRSACSSRRTTPAKSSGCTCSKRPPTVSRSPKQDLRLRRAGELAGTAQAGEAGTIGNIVDDFALYMRAKEAADAIVAADPELREPEHQPLTALLDDNASARALLVTA